MTLPQVEGVLQTTILMIIAVLQLVMVVGFLVGGGFAVWFARQVLKQLGSVVDSLVAPRVSLIQHTNTQSTGGTNQAKEVPASSKPATSEVVDPQARLEPKPEPKCKTCDARFKREPISSRIAEGITFLTLNCKRCGKDSEFNAEEITLPERLLPKDQRAP
jgi:hypothetical protein